MLLGQLSTGANTTFSSFSAQLNAEKSNRIHSNSTVVLTKAAVYLKNKIKHQIGSYRSWDTQRNDRKILIMVHATVA